jgi:hypothetical protein
MSEFVKALLTATLEALVAAIPVMLIAIWLWRRAPKASRDDLAEALRTGEVAFGPRVSSWLEQQFVRRQRWSAVILPTGMWAAFLVADWATTSWPFLAVMVAMVLILDGVAVTHAFRSTGELRQHAPTKRVAVMRPRSIRTYLSPKELTVFALSPIVGLGSVLVAELARPGAPENLLRSLIVLGGALIVVSLSVYLSQRRLVRLPMLARDEEEQIAHDLAVALALRELLVGVIWPVIALPLVAWNSMFEPHADLSANLVIAFAVLAALVAAFIAFPTTDSRNAVLWRFREADRRVPA